MTVLEPGPGMGFFTLPLARMVGRYGRVVAVDIQPRMLEVLGRRAKKAGLSDRVHLRLATSAGMGVEDLNGLVDFATALHVVHEVPDQSAFFKEVFETLKPGGRLLVVEPSGHVSEKDFQDSLARAHETGFVTTIPKGKARGRTALLVRNA
jgi:ubiquinone/menaquinone biosynthesis C-methylase UbiE